MVSKSLNVVLGHFLDTWSHFSRSTRKVLFNLHHSILSFRLYILYKRTFLSQAVTLAMSLYQLQPVLQISLISILASSSAWRPTSIAKKTVITSIVEVCMHKQKKQGPGMRQVVLGPASQRSRLQYKLKQMLSGHSNYYSPVFADLCRGLAWCNMEVALLLLGLCATGLAQNFSVYPNCKYTWMRAIYCCSNLSRLPWLLAWLRREQGLSIYLLCMHVGADVLTRTEKVTETNTPGAFVLSDFERWARCMCEHCGHHGAR